MSLLDNLPDLAALRRRQRMPDTLGGHKDTPAVYAADVPCWLQAAGDRAVTAYQGRGISITDKVYFTADPGATEQDQIIITKRNGIDEPAPYPVYEVRSKALPDASAGLGVLFRVMVERLTQYEQNR